MKVGSHALDDNFSSRAFTAGVDVLVHTPLTTMSQTNLDNWASRALISTLGAFPGNPPALTNLFELKSRGCTVMSGTDYGNPTAVYPGVDPDEINLLGQAGLSPTEILAAGTSVPAAYWGCSDLGSVAVGKAASVIITNQDPLITPTTLTTPFRVYLRGVEQ